MCFWVSVFCLGFVKQETASSCDGWGKCKLGVHEKLIAELKTDAAAPVPIDVGSCGIHTIHGVFKTGFKKTGWEVMELFVSVHFLFPDSPARGADYTEVTGSQIFGWEFSLTRWVENRHAAERAIQIWDHVKVYVEWLKTQPKSTQPTSKSFTVV